MDTQDSTQSSRLPTPAFESGSVLAGRYEIVNRLGHGGMGEVWRAMDLKLRVDVALKSIRSDRVRNAEAIEAMRR